MVLTQQNCLNETGNEFNYYIELSGILGVHTDYKVTQYGIFELTFDYGIVTVQLLNSPIIKKLIRKIDITNKTIENEYLIKSIWSNESRVCYRMLASQVQYANVNNYNILEVEAHRPEDRKNIFWNGYWLLGKYGYLMDNDTRDNFLIVVRPYFNELNITNQDILIHEFLKVPGALEVWRAIGWRWNGTFNTSDGSISRSILSCC